MLRSRLTIVAVALCAALGLTACGGDDSSVSVPSAAPTATTQSTPTVAPPTQTTAPPAQTTTTETTTTQTNSDSGGTSAPSGNGGNSGGSGGSSAGQSANERFKKYCEQNPSACGE
jgi:uncharacterized membrane protein YgcG